MRLAIELPADNGTLDTWWWGVMYFEGEMTMTSLALLVATMVVVQHSYERVNREDAQPNEKQVAVLKERIDRKTADRERTAGTADAKPDAKTDATKAERDRKRAEYLERQRQERNAKKRARDNTPADDKPTDDKPTPEQAAGIHEHAADLDDYGDLVGTSFKITQVLPGGGLLVREEVEVPAEVASRAYSSPAAIADAMQDAALRTRTITNDFILEDVDVKDAAVRPDATVGGWFYYCNKGTYKTVVRASRTLPILKALPGTVHFSL